MLTSRRFPNLVPFALVALLLMGASAFIESQNRVVEHAEHSLLYPYGSGTSTAYNDDGSKTTYDSVDERAQARAPIAYAVVKDHADDIDEIIEIRNDAPAPEYDPNAEWGYEPGPFDKTWFSRLEVTACGDYQSQVHLPWLRDDMDRICNEAFEAAARSDRDFIVTASVAHVTRRCAAAFQVFASDYPAAARKDRISFLDQGMLDKFVPAEAAEESEHAAKIKALLDDIETDLDDLVTEETCMKIDPSLDEPLEWAEPL